MKNLDLGYKKTSHHAYGHSDDDLLDMRNLMDLSVWHGLRFVNGANEFDWVVKESALSKFRQ
jgi:hypothetical protein